ncbi:MAG TPA: hypothetical protein VJU59_30930 [Paraburkholderia sp.]|uniref:hypothetical protein n=1 Tax=Paraburkholderia sp. TaxID=1926495 RepID=UPI002B48F045|nr:hypothetical protein [Paraburkholderia sp.]HKR44042.1 hypothetical protein [Paraburkholderia sp.]
MSHAFECDDEKEWIDGCQQHKWEREVSATSHLDPELKADLLAEARLIRSIRRGVNVELDRINRAVLKRSMSVESAMAYTKQQMADYFSAELGARRVSK